MDRLEQAQQRLDEALSRLEKAAGAATSSGANAEDVAALQRRCDVLEDRSRQMADRLDAAIGKIRGILEG
jgi:predicted  nucleic acid-binding Zn-ribbon protein